QYSSRSAANGYRPLIPMIAIGSWAGGAVGADGAAAGRTATVAGSTGRAAGAGPVHVRQVSGWAVARWSDSARSVRYSNSSVLEHHGWRLGAGQRGVEGGQAAIGRQWNQTHVVAHPPDPGRVDPHAAVRPQWPADRDGTAVPPAGPDEALALLRVVVHERVGG